MKYVADTLKREFKVYKPSNALFGKYHEEDKLKSEL